MGTSYPTSRLTVVCRSALPRALAAQSEVSSDVFSSVVVASQGSRAVGPGTHPINTGYTRGRPIVYGPSSCIDYDVS